MGPFARKALSEVRRFGGKAVLGSAQQFGRKLTHAAKHYGDAVSSGADAVSKHTDLLGLDGVSKGLRGVSGVAKGIADTGRLLDANQPKAAVDRVLTMLGKNY